MGLNPSQGQLGDLTHEGLEAFVFAHPLLDLREQVLGDINGAGFAFDFIGQVMGEVPLTGLAVAASTAAFAAERHQAGGDKRAVEFELLDARVEVAADQGGMLGDFHRAVI